jgi:hypothetical protein
MIRRLVVQFGLLFTLLAVPCLARAQKHTVIPLIPAANWHLVSTQPKDAEEVRQWGGDPAIEREYGVKTVVHHSYHLGVQRAEVLVEEALDPSSAYGLLTYYQTQAVEPVKNMELTLMGPQGALLARGRFFIRASRPPGAAISDDNFTALLIFVGGTGPVRADMARLPAALPIQGLVPKSERYLLGLEAARRVLPDFRTELIGFAQGAEVQVGKYAAGQARATVLAITYPTPQIARARFGAMESFLGINQERGAESIYGRRSGSIVILVLRSGSATTAKRLMDQFQITASVSWNERYPGAKSFTLQVIELVLANLLLSFFIAGFGVGGGILVFLGRRAATKWFPQWEWANPEHEAIIRLNLS